MCLVVHHRFLLTCDLLSWLSSTRSVVVVVVERKNFCFLIEQIQRFGGVLYLDVSLRVCPWVLTYPDKSAGHLLRSLWINHLFFRGERELIVYVGFSTQNPTLSECGSSFSFPCGRSTPEQSPPPAIGWMGTSIEVRPIDCNGLKFITGSRSTDPIVFVRQIS